MNAIKAVRNIRTEKNVPPSRKAHLYIETSYTDTFEKGKAFFERLCSASDVTVGESVSIENAAIGVTESAKLFLPMGELIDKEKELARLHKERRPAEGYRQISRKLSNTEFVSKGARKGRQQRKGQAGRARTGCRRSSNRLKPCSKATVEKRVFRQDDIGLFL